MKIQTTLSPIRIGDALLYAGALISILWSVYFSLVTLYIPYQIELREGAAPLMTEILLRGENPFVFDSQPLTMNNYGMTYNLFVLPFAWLFGNTLSVHRGVTFLFVIGSAALGFIVVHKNTGSKALALTSAAFIMTALIGRGGIGAFPSALGVFLFLFSVLFPFLHGFDQASLLASALSAIVAFHTKAYFVLGFGIVLLYLFLFISKRKAVFYTLAFLSPFFVSAVLIRFVLPLYFINTLAGNVSNASLSSQRLFAQLKDLLFIFYPVLIVLTICLFHGFFEGKSSLQHTRQNRNAINLFDLHLPLLQGSINYFLFIFCCCLLAFVLILGRHMGSYLNYAFQLLVPTFFIWLMYEVVIRERARLILGLIVLFNLFAWQKNLLSPVMLEQKDSEEWARAFEYLDVSSVTLNSPAVAAELIALGQMPMDSGQTAYFYAVEPFSENLLTGIPYAEFHQDGFRYMLLIDRMIEKQRFELVVTTREKANFYHDKLLYDYYQQVDEIIVDMPQTDQQWTLVFWKPLQK